jgi:uncharacterized protein (DUF362 family)
MARSKVILSRCSEYAPKKIAEAIQKQFELLGGLEKFVSRGDSVLLKPNFIAPRSRRYATQTHPAVIIETARLLIDFGAKPFIADSPAWSNVFACVKALKMEESIKKLSIPVKQLDKPKWCKIAAKNTHVGISSIALDADVIINMPKFKAHQQLLATFAVKNMFGCVCGKRKAIWHFRKGRKPDEFCQLLIDIYRHLNPALTIIDGVMAMDGFGPIRGRTRPLGWLISGTDPIACETICAKLININPQEIPIIKTANKKGVGCSDLSEIEIAGDDYSQCICTDFELPQLVPINFSFIHVCKSICKQIVLLSKIGIKKHRT